MQYQVTLICENGKYKPVSAIVTVETETEKSVLSRKGIEKICVARNWTKKDLQRYGYTKVKMRVYDKEKIERENKERYEKIKKEKYASGEWKRPKSDRG